MPRLTSIGGPRSFWESSRAPRSGCGSRKPDGKEFAMAFLSKSLPRRTLRRGIGTTLSLPFPAAMVTALGGARKPGAPFPAFYVPNGMAMEYWTPKGEGSNFQLAPIMEPLAAYKDQMIIFS